jgi:hypothetical protein
MFPRLSAVAFESVAAGAGAAGAAELLGAGAGAALSAGGGGGGGGGGVGFGLLAGAPPPACTEALQPKAVGTASKSSNANEWDLKLMN